MKLSKPGVLALQMKGPDGKVYDRREVSMQTISEQPVTFSRLQFGDGGQISIGADETARVYAGAGPLLRGMAMNVYTTSESWFGHAEALSARWRCGRRFGGGQARASQRRWAGPHAAHFGRQRCSRSRRSVL